ncbi:MAG: hypothetical protein WAV00_10530 [Nocardioides sp.]
MNDDLTNQLSRELHDRAGEMDGSALGLAGVQGRARSIRRRRTASVIVGVAAAVGVIVPTAALATHSGGKPEPAPITQSPSPTRTPTVDSRAALDVSGLEQGDPPRLDYLEGGILHEPAGGTQQVGTADPVDRFAVLADGTKVYHTRDSQGRTHVQVQPAQGDLSTPFPASNGLAVNTERTAAAWTTADGHVWVWHLDPQATGDSRFPARLPGTAPQALQVTGRYCSDGGTCHVLVQTTDPATGETTSSVVSSRGGIEPADPGGRFASMTSTSSTGLVAGLTRVTASGSCSAVADGAAAPTWRTCRHTLITFSPDARFISADAAYHDGPGSSVFAAYGVDGKLAFDHRSDASSQAFVAQSVWEDDTHVLGTVFQGGGWYVVRFGVDGSMQLAAGPVAGDMGQSPVVLPGAR